MQKIRKGFKPCPNFLWDIEGLNSKDRDIVMYLYSHSKHFVPSLRNIASKCGSGNNTGHIKKILLRIMEFLPKQSPEVEELEDFIEIRDTVLELIQEILCIKNNAPQETECIKNNAECININAGGAPKLMHDRIKIKAQVHKKNINKVHQLEKHIPPSKISKEEEWIVDFNQQLQDNKTSLLEMEEIRGDRELLIKHYLYFCDYIRNKGKKYKNPVAAFRNAIRGNWAKVENGHQKFGQLSFDVQNAIFRKKAYDSLSDPSPENQKEVL